MALIAPGSHLDAPDRIAATPGGTDKGVVLRRSPLRRALSRRSLSIAAVAAFTAPLLAPSVATAAVPGSDLVPTAANPCPWVGSTASPVERANALLRAMTLDDKIAMVHGTAGVLQAYGPTYAGQVAANARLCIPALSPSDGPAGVGNGQTGVTQLPAPINLGATWNRDLSRQYGQVVAAEDRAKGANMMLGPDLDIARDSRWGRFFETLGEDPTLIGEMAATEVGGIHSQGVLATAKHLAAYTQETGRNTDASSEVDERTLQEEYLAQYQPVVDAGVDSVMCSYNEVNGVHGCNDTYTMTQALKGQMGFQGFTVSDWFGMHASLASANAGLDLQMPDACYYGTRLRTLVDEGKVSTDRLDDMVRRITARMFAQGLFDRGVDGSPDARVTTDAHVAVGARVAAEGSVLMRNNDNLLPLGSSTHSIAVIGSAAGRNAIGSGGGSAHVIADQIVTPLQGIAREAKARGVSMSSYTGALPSVAADTARKADVAVVVVSKMLVESKDQDDLNLSLTDRLVLDAVTKANPNTIVVVNSGAAVDLSPAASARAMLWMGYPGQTFGTTLANMLWGSESPSGRLPFTWPADQSKTPTSDSRRFPGGHYDEGLSVGYRWYDQNDVASLGVMGSGLTYTSFDYSNLQVGGEQADGTIPVSFTVTNTGQRAGEVVPQLYADQTASAPATPRELKDFTKISLDAGESRTVTLQLTARDLSHWDVASHRWMRDAGDYAVHVGDNAEYLPLAGTAHVATGGATSDPTPAAPAGSTVGNETAAESVKDAFVCGNGGFMAGGVGLASYVGLPPAKQAVIAPTDQVQP